MRRFFTSKITKPEMMLSGDEHKHFAEVLRGKIGDKVIICPNDGLDYIYEVTAINKKTTIMSHIDVCKNGTETQLELTVFFAMLKGDKSEWVAAKLTELGVRRMVPFISEFTVKTGEKTERLRRAAVEACKQCGRAVLPEVCDVTKFDDVLKLLAGYDKVVFAYEGAYADGKRLSGVLAGSEKKVALIVGAEGGFSESEVKSLADCGIPAVTLGRRILRAETASVACASVIMYICGEWE